jgi:hypothetical protein
MKAAKKLRERLADLRAATNISELIAGRPREIEGRRFSYFAVDLANSYRIVLCANHNKVPLLKTGGIDWAKVRRLKVHKIEVCHE